MCHFQCAVRRSSRIECRTGGKSTPKEMASVVPSYLDPALRNVGATARAISKPLLRSPKFLPSFNHVRSLSLRQSRGFRQSQAPFPVRAAAQKQKRENAQTSKITSPPLPEGALAPSTPLETSTDDKTTDEAGDSDQEVAGISIEASSVAVDGAAAVQEGASTISAETDSLAPSSSRSGDKQMSQEEIGQALKTLRQERVAQGLDNPSSTVGFWGGVLEETKLVEWPTFQKVLGTTGVVVAIIFGSSLVLLTVNAILAELSDNIFSNGEFAKAWTRGL